jgi:hypothetical protein
MVRLTTAILALLAAILLSPAGISDSITKQSADDEVRDEAAGSNAVLEPSVKRHVDADIVSARAAKQVSPMMQEIFAAVEQQNTKVNDLRRQLKITRNNADAIHLIRQIEQAKLGAEQQALQIQLTYAQSEGRLDDATKLSKAIEAVDRMMGERPVDAVPLAPGSERQ